MNPIIDTKRQTNAHSVEENAIPEHVVAAILLAFTEIEQILFSGHITEDAKENLSISNAAFWAWFDREA